MVALGRVNAILSVEELDDVASRVPDREVVLDPEVLHRIDEAPLHVARLLGPDCRVDEPLPASHCVEEELRRSKPVPVVSLDETLGLRREVIGQEVAERAPVQSLLDPLPSDRLLSQGCCHLSQVEGRTPGAGPSHDYARVLGRERLVGYPAGPDSLDLESSFTM